MSMSRGCENDVFFDFASKSPIDKDLKDEIEKCKYIKFRNLAILIGYMQTSMALFFEEQLMELLSRFR